MFVLHLCIPGNVLRGSLTLPPDPASGENCHYRHLTNKQLKLRIERLAYGVSWEGQGAKPVKVA